MSKKRCACIIDDDKIYAYGVKKIIDKHQLSNSILIFENGEEAIHKLRNLHLSGKTLPDVILLDIDMPKMNGWEFLTEFQQLRSEIDKKIDIFVISSKIDKVNADIYKYEWNEKVSDYISKPIKAEDLVQIMV